MAIAGNEDESILSPCVGVCAMSENTGLCYGCHRTMDEIRDWWNMTPETRNQAMRALKKR